MTTKMIALALTFLSTSAFATALPVAYPQSAYVLEGIGTPLEVAFGNPGKLDAANCAKDKTFPVPSSLIIKVGLQTYAVASIDCAVTDINQINNEQFVPDTLTIMAKNTLFAKSITFLIRKDQSVVVENQNELPMIINSTY
jgi:hypothetical protein